MKILFLGHSLIEYFDWQGRFPQHTVHNLGLAGETASGLLARIDGIAADHSDPDAVLVMTGTNDVLMGDRAFPDAFRRTALKLKGSYPEARIIFQSILPVDPDWLDPEVTIEVNRELHEIARGAEVEFLDLTDLFAAPDGKARPEMLLEDGVHLSPEGYRAWSAALEKTLNL